MNDIGYLTCAETARLIRAQLKRNFPGVRFGVRSKTYSMGASINVAWIDGPTTEQVEAVAKDYEGGGFDGMIDLAYTLYAWLLPDGSATPAASSGTTGSMGAHEGYEYPEPASGARLVHFGATSVFCERRYSETFARQIRDRLADDWSQVPGDFPEVREAGTDSWCLDWDHPSRAGGPGGCEPVRLFRDCAEERGQFATDEHAGLIEDAAEAIEIYGEDELERYAVRTD